MKFQELLEEHHIPHHVGSGHHHAREGWIQFDCPFCGKDSGKFHMGFSIQRRSVNCYRCGPHRLIETLMELTELSFPKLKSIVGDFYERLPQQERIKGKLTLPKGLGPLLKAHRLYLEGRGFDIETLEKLWHIQGIGIASKLAWRVFIPFILRGNVVSWLTRSIKELGMRYWSASAEQEAINHKSLLYGEDYVRHTIIICEGPVDVWAIGPGSVATCGTSFTRAQIIKVAKYPRRVICFDNEPKAQKRARDLCDAISVFPGETHNVCLDSGKDPGSASSKELKRLRRLYLS